MLANCMFNAAPRRLRGIEESLESVPSFSLRIMVSSVDIMDIGLIRQELRKLKYGPISATAQLCCYDYCPTVCGMVPELGAG